MNNIEKSEEVCDQSRRTLLKKSYAAPAVIALGSMSFSTDAKAWGGRWGGRWGGSRSTSSSGGSSLSGGSKCNRCFRFPCCCR